MSTFACLTGKVMLLVGLVLGSIVAAGSSAVAAPQAAHVVDAYTYGLGHVPRMGAFAASNHNAHRVLLNSSDGEVGPATTTAGDVQLVDARLRALERVRVAAKNGDEVADVGHAGIHQFPGIKSGKSQFFDAEDLGKLSDTSSLSGTLQKNGNTRYVLKRGSDVGVDRTSGLPTNVYTVIRKPDGSVLTMFPGTSPKS